MSYLTDTLKCDSSDHHTIKAALRAITHKRPAGSIFRDLLLRADDEGATSFELILDPRNHPTDQLVHPALAEFQGPSLLACDNSVLIPSSFESLPRVGGALELPGRNMAERELELVDNLIDSPSVLSRSKLFVLDLELGWSTDRVGRPTYDFIEKSDRLETRNQEAAFEAVQYSYNTGLEGKIIRIPLRTDEQTVGAVDRFMTEVDVRSAFLKFRGEMVESLLFLKNIVSITLRIITEEGVYAKAKVVGTEDGIGGRSSVATTLHQIFVDRSRLDFDTSFLVTIHYCGRDQEDNTSEWEIFHHARSHLGADEELTKWGETRGLVPWVGLAALVRVEGFEREETEFCGRLFTRLPLPIHTRQSVHIHGMFSPTPDRASIYHVQDRMVPEDSDVDQCSRWNETLSEECLAFAWSRFLLSLTSTGVIEDGFRYWPRNMDRNPRSGDWTPFVGIFLEIVVHTELPVWPTCQGWLSANKVFLAPERDRGINDDVKSSHLDEQSTMHALEWVGMPVIRPPSEIYGDTRKCFERAGERLLTPITAARFLRIASGRLTRASQDIRQRLLEYLLSESPQTGYAHLDGIALFPMCDGSFAASGTLSPPILMLPMDEDERKLFSLRPHITIDVRRIGVNTLRRLRQDIEKVETETSLKQWGLEDVYEYCMATYFSEINPYVTSDIVDARDICGLEREFAKNLASLWDWIISRVQEDASIIPLLSQLGSVWLIPIVGRSYRRVSPTSKQLLLDPSPREELGNFLKSMCKTKVDAYWTNQLYHSDLMSASTTEFFRERGIVQPCDNLENLMDWLDNRPQFVSLFCSRERNELVRFLQMLSADFLKSGNSSGKNPQLLRQLRRLPVFEEIRNNSKDTSLNWTTLERAGVTKYVAVTMENVVPDLDGIVFLNARNPSTLWLLGQFALAEVPDMRQLLDEYVFPGILAQNMNGILERLATFALGNFDLFPAGGVAKMADMQFVPVQSWTDRGVVTRCLKTPRQCVDPGSGLGDLFFAYESVWIDDEFWKAYSGKLAGMELIDKITVELVLDRVRAYSNVPSGADTKELARKVEMLIIASTELDIPSLRSSGGRPWLPARKYPSEVIVMASPEDCRDESFTGLVGYGMPIVPFTVGKTWSKALGWGGLIPPVTIQKHLQVLVDRKEFLGLRIVLDYLDQNSQANGYLDGIREMKWIMGVSGGIFKCEDIFFNHAARLSPSCDCIDNGLGESYKSFFTFLGVQENPSLPRLKRLIDDLDRGDALDQSDLDLVIDAILLATELYPQEDFTKFKAPDCSNTLRDLSTLISGKPEYCEAELFFLHPGISQQSISVLGIPTLGQRQFDGAETHSDQGLEPAETRMAVIRNTMKRFPVECTFNTYLRNAENSGTATKVGWVLDSNGGWEKASILTEELGDTMGPALLFWSDGVLEEKDLSQLLSFVGRTKSSEMEGAGSFNPGTLAMYHWSSVPQIISRDYLVILDPEEKYLPLNRYTKRRYIGMKISLQKMRKQYTDHLKPFYGVLGFGPESEFLEGTIFRLPFRKPGSGSGLVPDNLIIDADSALVLMVNYFTEAKRSLLFLARITTVEFRIKDTNSPEWKVSITRGPAEGIILGGTVEQIFIESRQRSSTPSMANDEWRLARCEVSDALVPKNLRATQKEHGLNTRCGIAALVSHRYTGSRFDGQLFSSLPFTWLSMLPVHIQASFVFTDGEGSSPPEQGVEDEWNPWILEYGVVDLYLDFLEYLSSAFGELSFKFWPPHEGAPGSLSDKLRKAFWRKLSGCDLKLFPVEENKPKTSILDLIPVGVNHKLTRETLSLAEVIFDFLGPEYSNILRALLGKLGVKNIVSPTEVMSKALQDLEGITKIDPPYISSLLRSNPKTDVLHEIWAADDYSFDRLGPFLEFMMKGPNHSSDILTECRILPLANLKLGILGNPCIHGVSSYYIVQRGTLDLFDYAPGLVVHPDVSQATTNIILKLDLNVSILPPSDFPRLFANVSESDKISLRLHCFLLKFWVAIRYEYEGRPTVVLSNLPVHSATVNGQLHAISPDEFEYLPAIVSPDDEGESSICSKLPALYLVDRRTVSTVMQKTEQLSASVGLMRFITSLGKLAKLKHKNTEAFFLLFLEQEHIMLLRRLVKRVVTKQVLMDHPSATLILKSLPLWPTMSGKLVSAVDGLLAPDPRFCVSWIEGQERFIDPVTSQGFSSVLQLLGVNRLKAAEFVSSCFRNTLDLELTPAALKIYRSFIEAYIEHIGAIPPDYALALDGNCCFRLSRDLYDHSEGIFIAAFRGVEKRCFLHPDLRHLKDWYTPGLRSMVSGLHYYECVTSINKRAGLSGPRIQLEFDAATVFRYLRTNQSLICERWSAEDLRRIRGVQFVPLLRHLAGQPRHRRDGMNKISSIRTFGSLEDSINSEYLDVCWSQCPISAKSPGDYVLQQIPSKGIPSVRVVFRHIEYLAVHRNEVRSLHDIQLYIRDISASYRFLDNHYGETKYISEKAQDTDPRALDTVMWLNMDEPIDANFGLFETSWVSAKDLCLGIDYDFSHYRYVRSTLASYGNLLTALGVTKIQKPKLETTALNLSQRESVCEKFFSFWQQGKLCDVELEVGGVIFKAHRIVLASGSSRWENVLIGGWRDAGERGISIKETAAHTVSAMLHFMYTSALPPLPTDKIASENLEHMMDWLVAADQWEMTVFKSHIEEMVVERDYIRPENVRWVLGIAREAQAKILSNCCEAYIKENQKVIERIDYPVT